MTADATYTGAIHPPFAEQITELRPASIWVKLKKTINSLVAGAVIGGLIWGVGWLFDVGWLRVGGIGVAIFIAGTGLVLGLFGKVAACPYCGKTVGTGANDDVAVTSEAKSFECSHCFQLLVAEDGKVRALRESDVTGQDTVEVMALKSGQWPEECIVCGAPPTRFEEAKMQKVQYAALLVGTISVQSGKLRGIPYCDRHSGEVSLNIRDEALRVVFTRLDMARRYLAVNSERKAIKI